MKWRRCTLTLVAGVALAGCDSMNGPIRSGSFDPLTPPGGESGLPVVDVTGGIVPGKIAAIAMDNAAFFNERPHGEADPDELLMAGTQVKVVSVDGSYLKVELDNGKVGFVPAMMVRDPDAVPSPNEIQVYPAAPGDPNVPIVPLEPAVAPPPGSDDVPSVIDPDEPVAPPPPPPVPEDLGTPSPPIRE